LFKVQLCYAGGLWAKPNDVSDKIGLSGDVMTFLENDQSLPNEIARYYQRGMEVGRLSSPFGELELVRTQEILRRYLPAPPAVVLDVGGGPGTYAAWLARLGYEVHLTDPIPLHLEQANKASQEQPKHPIASISLGDARSLAQPDESADAILLFGPLYHLLERNERLAALQEARRVLRKDGFIFAVGISRFASTLDGLMSSFLDDPDFVHIARRDLADGQHRNPTDKPHYFTSAFLHHPYELRGEIEAAGLQLVKILTIEGIAVFLQDLDERWADARRRDQLLEAVRWLEDDPAVLGITGHFMAVARR
jgi:SAM-dependent methyltransferase